MHHENIDALIPSEMALKAENIGVIKVNMPQFKTFILAILAGAFIALGSVFFTITTSEPIISFGFTRLIGGFTFSLGLILVVIGGAELFTGNNLIIMAWANKKISVYSVFKNWIIVYLGNAIGSISIVVLMFFSKQYLFASGKVGLNMLAIAKTKCELEFFQAIALGILCNALVCLAIWLCFSARSITGKIVAIIFPITAFVASGFEHSIANMYFIPKALILLNFSDNKFQTIIQESGIDYKSISWYNFFFNNLIPVTIGNGIGGAFLVGIIYWFIYLRKTD